MNAAPQTARLDELKAQLVALAATRGFDALGVTHVDSGRDAAWLERWIAAGRHGEMDYMWKHGTRRTRPDELVPGTVRVLSARMNYWPAEGAEGARPAGEALADADAGYVSRYALGRDYHKILRNALQGLADDIVARVGPMGYRVFVDSGPVLEKAFARNAGLRASPLPQALDELRRRIGVGRKSELELRRLDARPRTCPELSVDLALVEPGRGDVHRARTLGEPPRLSARFVSGGPMVHRAERVPGRDATKADPRRSEPVGVAGREAGGLSHRGGPARAVAAAGSTGVEAQARDDHVDVAVVRVDADPVAGAG